MAHESLRVSLNYSNFALMPDLRPKIVMFLDVAWIAPRGGQFGLPKVDIALHWSAFASCSLSKRHTHLRCAANTISRIRENIAFVTPRQGPKFE